MSLVSLADMKTYLGLTTTTNDTLLNLLIINCSDFINHYVNRRLEAADYKQLYSGNGNVELMLDNYPINTVDVLSQELDNENEEYDNPITASKIYRDSSGMITLFDDIFSKGHVNIYVEYNAGYTVIPKGIEMIAMDLIAKKFKDAESGHFGIAQKNVMGENVSFIIRDLSSLNRSALAKYIKPPNQEGIDVTGWVEAS